MAASNYVDPAETRPVDLGPCRCPGVPHERDSADVVTRFGYGERGRIAQAGRLGGIEAAHQMLILIGVKRWTFVVPGGGARPIDAEQVGRLDKATVERLLSDDVLGAAMADDPLPNTSGGPSRGGPRANGSRTRTTRAPASSTST